jgi:hypothetical protein
LGKTALADRITRDLTKSTRFDDIAWVTAKQTHLSSLGRLQMESNRPALTFPMLIDQLAAQFDLPQSESDTSFTAAALSQAAFAGTALSDCD